MKVVSVNIGERKKVEWKGKVIETGIFKYPVNTPIFLDKEDVQGDHVVNRVHHGGVLQAAYAYGAQHYGYWKQLYPDHDWNYGMFGENITFDTLDETTIRVGAIYQLGNAKVKVTKPRQPCLKLGIRFNDVTMIKRFWNSTKSGLYFKILETGTVAKNDELVLLENRPENMTIAELYTAKRIAKGM